MDSGERSEEPTAKKREKFRKDGKLAVSRDVGGVAIGATMLLVSLATGGAMFDSIAGLFARTVAAASLAPNASASSLIDPVFQDGFKTAIKLLTAMCGTATLVAIMAGLAQTGANFTTKALEFKWERVGLFSGLKRALFSTQAVTQIGLALAKALVLGGVLAGVLRVWMSDLPGLSRGGLGDGLGFIGMLLLQVLLAALLCSAALAALDYALARRRVGEDMKMTKQEVKDEHKQQEGDPLVRQRMRQRMREIGRNQMLAATRKADVVVVNPTHFAVALAYSFGQAGAPRVLAKGADAVAARIREVARKHQIPIVTNPPVARAVYHATRVGREVPPEMYEMVARVLAYLFRMGHKRIAT